MPLTILEDAATRNTLFPFAQIASILDIRVGILTLREKWEHMTGEAVSVSAQRDGQWIYPANLVPGEFHAAQHTTPDPERVIEYPWDIFRLNDQALREDFSRITHERQSEQLPKSVQAIDVENIFIEEGARLSHCILNASRGPIYIGKNAEVMEGATIRGPFALCEGAVVKMGARIYGATTVGPFSVVGGEIKNCVFFGHSNKGHDGYLGDSVIAEWCNLGAGTSASNLKNTAGAVKVWHQASAQFIDAGKKCGVLMGDYSRCAINTSFNTGTVVGVCANIFGNGLTPKLVANFTWGTEAPSKYELDKALRDIANWKRLKNSDIFPEEIQALKNIFEQS